MDEYFAGNFLWGDDFSEEQIKKWYDEEAEAFADLYGVNVNNNSYSFHDLNILYGYKYLKHINNFDKVLGLGASWGYEFLPIIDKINKLWIIESSLQTRSERLKYVVPTYITPNIRGNIDLQNDSFDLITCFDTLHHIPNVTYVLNELFRLLKPGGYLLLREPVHSMGDWRKKRLGLTVHERGIPKDYLDSIILNANMKIIQKHYYGFMGSFLLRLFNGASFFQSNTYLNIDKHLSSLFSFNIHYHEKFKIQRVAPSNVFYVLRK